MSKPETVPSIQYRDFSAKLHERAARQDRVIKAQMEVTYRCNLHCVHCYTDPYNKQEFFPREMTLPEIKRILDEMADLGILYLNLTGGEIFMRRDFFEIYEYAYGKGFLLQLYTNGTVFTQSIIDRLRQLRPFSIDVSCHSVDEEAFDRFTQVPGSFRRFTEGMKLLFDSGLPFSFRTLAMSWNKEELPQIRRYIESFGQPFKFTTSLSARLDGDTSSLDYRLTPEDVRVLEGRGQQADLNMDDCREAEAVLGASGSDRLYRCGCATDTIHISAWGELGTCTMQYEYRASLRKHSLKDAIAKVFAEVRAQRYTDDTPCRSCAIHAFCEKMPSDAKWEAGNPQAPIPYDCDVALVRAQRVSRKKLSHPLNHSEVCHE